MTEISYENDKLLLFIINKLPENIEKHFDKEHIIQIFSETIHLLKEMEIPGKREFFVELYLNNKSLICKIIQSNFIPFSEGGWADYFGVYSDGSSTPFINLDRISTPILNFYEWINSSLKKISNTYDVSRVIKSQYYYYILQKNENETLTICNYYNQNNNDLIFSEPILLKYKSYGIHKIYPRSNTEWKRILKEKGLLLLDEPVDNATGKTRANMLLFKFFEKSYKYTLT